MKKIIAIALAAMMLLGCAVFASAAETTLPDQTFEGWWTAWSQGTEITEEGFTMTFDVKSENATANYESPSLIIHAGSADALGTEYWVQRADAWGWFYGENVGDHAAALQEKGYAWEFLFADGFDWANFVPTLVAGTSATVTAKLEGSNVLLTYEMGGITNKVTIPVDTANPVFLTITGQNTAISNVKIVTPDAEEQPPVETPTEGYIAKLGFANSDWSVCEWGDNVNTTVTGEGTYTLTFNGSATNALVFVVDIEGAAADFAEAGFDVTALTITADGVEVPVDVTKLNTGDLEGNGKFRIEIYNEYGETKHNPPVDPNAVSFASELVITFTIAVPGAEEVPPTGDAIFAVLSVMVASGLGLTAVVSKKK